MELIAIVTMLAVAQYFYFGGKVGAGRGKYGISAPATTGHETFERLYRVHYHTLEQLMSFIPALWVFGFYVSELYGAIIGLVYLVGRALFSIGYVKEPKSRAIGAIMSGIPCLILIVGGFIGAVSSYLDKI